MAQQDRIYRAMSCMQTAAKKSRNVNILLIISQLFQLSDRTILHMPWKEEPQVDIIEIVIQNTKDMLLDTGQQIYPYLEEGAPENETVLTRVSKGRAKCKRRRKSESEST